MDKSICQKQRFLFPFSPGLFELFFFLLIGPFIFLCCVIRLSCFEVALVGWGGSGKDLVNMVILSWQEKKQVLLLREKLTFSLFISLVL